jgi:hypothetical protein
MPSYGNSMAPMSGGLFLEFPKMSVNTEVLIPVPFKGEFSRNKKSPCAVFSNSGFSFQMIFV